MIYLDSSVALAQIFAEDRKPPEDLWAEPPAASRLLHYEVWNRVHARRLGVSHGDKVRDILDAVIAEELTDSFSHALSRSSRPRVERSMRFISRPWTSSAITVSESS